VTPTIAKVAVGRAFTPVKSFAFSRAMQKVKKIIIIAQYQSELLPSTSSHLAAL
jgi:hypothetical protein